MDNSEDLDLDSLMELLDDGEQFEDECSQSESSKSTQSVNTPESSVTASDKPPQRAGGTPYKIPLKTIALSNVDLFSSESPTENIPRENLSSSNSSQNGQPQEKRRKVLKSGFKQNLLEPRLVENPKKDEVYEKHVFNKKESAIFNFGEMGSSDEEVEQEDKDYLNETGKAVKKMLKEKELPRHPEPKRKSTAPTWSSGSKPITDMKPGEKFVVDSYSGIRIVNPLVSSSMLQQRMGERRMIKMSFIQNHVKGSDIEGDWVTMGVIISKVPPKTSKNGKAYSIWKMSDLNDPEKPVSVFLFKAAHTDHWKTTVGTVLGILNPSIMPNNNNKSGELCLAVDHPGKFMVLGTSKDLGYCRSNRKNGEPCNIAVNKLQCEYCTYHVKNEYKKFSAKRSELQASYNGREPSLKNRVLKGSNVFYGGQSFTALGKKPTNNLKSKDKLTLSNLGLKRKATEALEIVEKEKGVKKLAELFGPEILPAANNNSEFINAQLAKPTVGSRNLLQHIMKEKTNKEGGSSTVISSQELLRMRNLSARGVLQQHKNDSTILKNLAPQLGRGLQPGQEFSFEFSPSAVSKKTQNFAKMQAIQKIKQQGQLKRKDPNSVKVSSNSGDKVKAVLDKSFEEEKVSEKVEAKSSVGSSVVKSTLGSIDLNSDKVKAMLQRGSSHAYEVETTDMQKEAAYFNELERKEQMEEKMASTKEIVCDVVSCLKCKYTADTSSDRCKKENHPLKCHKALKRFFQCKDCKRRTVGFSRLPKFSCRGCHGSNFERTSMMKVRKGPKLDSETLNICADDRHYLNSL